MGEGGKTRQLFDRIGKKILQKNSNCKGDSLGFLIQKWSKNVDSQTLWFFFMPRPVTTFPIFRGFPPANIEAFLCYEISCRQRLFILRWHADQMAKWSATSRGWVVWMRHRKMPESRSNCCRVYPPVGAINHQPLLEAAPRGRTIK